MIENPLIEVLEANHLLRSPDEVAIFEQTLSELAQNPNPADLPSLHLILDDACQQREVMLSLIHFLESFEVQKQLHAFIQVLPHLVERAPEWTAVLHSRMMNDAIAQAAFDEKVRSMDAREQQEIHRLLSLAVKRQASNQNYRSNYLLSLLQLAFAPVGAFSYSEGIESLVETGAIDSEISLKNWLQNSLQFGAVRVEAAVAARALRAANSGDLETLSYWNDWATAAKETEELRLQSWQMGRTLVKLLLDLRSPAPSQLPAPVTELAAACGNSCNYAIAFGIAAACWQIAEETAAVGYLYSWAANLASAGVKLIPLGQTAGQQLLLDLHSQISCTAREVLQLEDDDLGSCSWGLALASMAHETQYTRLFRS